MHASNNAGNATQWLCETRAAGLVRDRCARRVPASSATFLVPGPIGYFIFGRSSRPSRESLMPEVILPEANDFNEVLWVEPYPDFLLERFVDRPHGPETRYDHLESISLAFVRALQQLPPRHRAALILRDVLGLPIYEVAQILDSTEQSVASKLERARVRMQSRLPDRATQEPPPLPGSAVENELVARFTNAFESGDVDGIVALLSDDVRFAMPPIPREWRERDGAAPFLAAVCQGHTPRLIATRANGQPAFGIYAPDSSGRVLHAIGMLVVTLVGNRICEIIRFDTSVLRYFRLARTRSAGFGG